MNLPGEVGGAAPGEASLAFLVLRCTCRGPGLPASTESCSSWMGWGWARAAVLGEEVTDRVSPPGLTGQRPLHVYTHNATIYFFNKRKRSVCRCGVGSRGRGHRLLLRPWVAALSEDSLRATSVHPVPGPVLRAVHVPAHLISTPAGVPHRFAVRKLRPAKGRAGVTGRWCGSEWGAHWGRGVPQEEGMVRVQPGVRMLDTSASRVASSQGFCRTAQGGLLTSGPGESTAPLGDGCGRILSTEVKQTERDISHFTAQHSAWSASTLCSHRRPHLQNFYPFPKQHSDPMRQEFTTCPSPALGMPVLCA